MTENIFTPSQLNRLVKGELEMSFPSIWLEGEISNLSKPASGHLYFSLKDDKAQISCALFRGQRSKVMVEAENGLLVRVRGKVSLYEARGNYQLIADRMDAAGAGVLQQQFEELKQRLQKEGLFAAEAKQALPEHIQNIAVITSESGAVIRDIISIFKRRWPLASLRLYPVPVQGNAAAPAIVAALTACNRHNWAEVVLLGRGGGSLEDLWAFNEESVARAVFASTIPVVSAVGHEVDTVITDFVADLRAATPSAAAELLSRDQRQIKSSLRQHETKLRRAFEARLQANSQQLDNLEQRLLARHPARQLDQQQLQLAGLNSRLKLATNRSADDYQQRMHELKRRLGRCSPRDMFKQIQMRIKHWHGIIEKSMQYKLEQSQNALQARVRTLQALSPLTTLERGYSVTQLQQNSEIVLSTAQLKAGSLIKTQLACGEVESKVTTLYPQKTDP